MVHPFDTARPVGHVRLEFTEGKPAKILKSLSGVEQIGSSLWIAGDETHSLERLLAKDYTHFAEHKSYPLGGVFHLQDAHGSEVDLEGLSFDRSEGRLWLTGSHSRKRCKPKDRSKNIRDEELGPVVLPSNRFLLASLKVKDADGPKPKLVLDSARALPFTSNGNILMDALARNALFKPYLALPSKDNGFDIEGIAASKGRIFVGLRGPVIGGFASILQLRPQNDGTSALSLAAIGDSGNIYCHHLLDLDGLGIRDICVDGHDLLILAGPTMSLDGPFRVIRWRGALHAREDTVVDRWKRQILFDIPSGYRVDHAEGMTVLEAAGEPRRLLIVYDSPAEERRGQDWYFEADLFALD